MFKINYPKKTLSPEDLILIEQLTAPRLLLIFLMVLSGLVYFTWRITTLNPNAIAFSVTFLVLELIGFVMAIAFMYSNARFLYRKPSALKNGLSVDVVIPTYNETIEIVKKTVLAAVNIEYPHETWLLDDGNRVQMRELAEELGCHYLARADNLDAKAGNLNHALPYLQGDFIALFDADDIAHPKFLDKTLTYFENEKLAIVQVPQEFYNLNSYQHLTINNLKNPWDETSLFYRVILRGRDCRNAVMFCGSSAVLRRSAIDDIGGFATGTLTEDLHTSMRLHAAGWESISHPESLSAGFAPCEPYSFLKQRLRWAQGSLQVFIKEMPLTKQGLSKSQRFAYGMHAAAHFERARASLLYFLPPIILLTGVAPINVQLESYLYVFTPYFILSLLAFKEFSRGQSSLLGTEIFNISRCHTSIVALSGLVKKNIVFWVTPKGGTPKLKQYFFLLPIVIFTANFIGLLNAWIFHWVAVQTPTLSALIIITGWSLYGLVPAMCLMIHTARCARSRGSSTNFLYANEVTLRVNQPNHRIQHELRTFINTLNVERLSIKVSDAIPLAIKNTVYLNVNLGQKNYALQGAVTAIDMRNKVAEVLFEWHNLQQKESFDLALHIAQIEAFSEYDEIDHITYLWPVISFKKWLKAL
jgi:cellulose synthase (UDP-forming)